jgi:hypothetical protein
MEMRDKWVLINLSPHLPLGSEHTKSSRVSCSSGKTSCLKAPGAKAPSRPRWPLTTVLFSTHYVHVLRRKSFAKVE